MKTSYGPLSGTLCLIVFLLNQTFAQDWNPLRVEHKTYAWQLDGETDYFFIRVDSIQAVLQDTSYFLNPIITPCDTCTTDNSSDCSRFFFGQETYFYRNQPHFLQKRVREAQPDVWVFEDTSSFVLNAGANIGEVWVFDTLGMVTANVVEIDSMEVLGRQVLVKTIILSTGDTILLGQELGLIQFPKGYGQGMYYQLVGIQGEDLGIRIPQYRDLIDFEIGDQFRYNQHRSWPGYQDTEASQYKIMEKTVIGDTFRYRVEGNSRTDFLNSSSAGGGLERRYDTINEVLELIDVPASHFLNSPYTRFGKVKSFTSSNDSIWSKVTYEIHPDFGRVVLSIASTWEKGVPARYYCWGNDSSALGSTAKTMLETETVYVDGIGEVWNYSQASGSYWRELIGFQSGSYRYGNFLPFLYFKPPQITVVDPPDPPAPIVEPNYLDSLQLGPNPVRESDIYIYLDSLALIGTTLMELTGRTVCQPSVVFISEKESKIVCPSRIRNGLYLLRIETIDGTKTFKVQLAR